MIDWENRTCRTGRQADSGRTTRKKTLIAAGFASLMTTTAMADGIGVSMALFDDNFLTVLRNGIQSQADAAGLSVQIEDAQNDVANNWIRSTTSSRRASMRSS